MIGLGAMGLPMARNIIRAGFPLRVWARNPQQAEPIRSEGADWADSPKELADQSDLVVLAVSDASVVAELVEGGDGLLAGFWDKDAAAKDSPSALIVDMSTIAPSVSRLLAEKARSRGVLFLDAPVSGGTQGAEAGTLTIMVGGEREIFEQALPALAAMGKQENIFQVGPFGAGEVVKIVNNILCGAIAAAIAESFVLGVKAGADVETMAKVIGVSSGASWQLANQFPLRAFNGTFQPGFMTDLLHKDLGLALDLAAENEVPTPMTALTRQMYEMARAEGYGRNDYTAVLKVLEQMAGVVTGNALEDLGTFDRGDET